jgi:hypothetical protein
MVGSRRLGNGIETREPQQGPSRLQARQLAVIL